MAYTASLTAQGWVIDPIVAPALDLLGNAAPMSEARLPAAGALDKASRSDHQHPRLTSSTRVTLDASGVATVTYTRSFTSKPVISLIAHNPSGRQVMLEVTGDVQTGADYTGCTIRGSRAQLLPTLTAIVTDLLKLSGFDVLGGSAAGVEVSVIAIMPSN